MSLVSSLRSAVLDSLTIPGLLLLMLVVGLSGQPLSAQETANGSEAGPAKAWKLGILVSSDADRCYKSGLVKAIRSFAEREISQINGNGGIAGRSVELQVFDDYEDKNQTLAHMKTALADPSMIGVVGIGSSTRGHFVFDLLKQQVRDNGMPIVTDISLSQIYAPFP
ncbi:MAG: hypothetical protein ACR2PA_10000, partial [Hyphomicrobiaceae bacterium]